MSVVCTVAAASATYLAAGILTGIAASAATAMGLRQLQAAEGAILREEARERAMQAMQQEHEAAQMVEVSTARSAALQELVAERCELHFGSETFQITLTRDLRGKLTVRAHGEGMSRQEVTDRAERFLGLLQQQIAYREVVSRMKAYGLDVAEEARLEDGTVKVRIAKKR